jgi:hypothetical protein
MCISYAEERIRQTLPQGVAVVSNLPWRVDDGEESNRAQGRAIQTRTIFLPKSRETGDRDHIKQNGSALGSKKQRGWVRRVR